MKNFKLLIFFLVTLVVSFKSFAGGKVIGNGGDVRALEFYTSARAAILDLQKNPSAYPISKDYDLLAILDKAEILISEVPIFANKDDVRQFSTAINHHDPDTIVVYGPLWASIKNQQVRKAIALHEVLGLAGIEGTGVYTVSHQYLSDLGIRCKSGLCEGVPRYSCALIKMPSSNIPNIEAVGTLGNSGEQTEILDLRKDKIKATITMNTDSSDGFIMLLLYQNNVTVSISELHGAAFPPFLQLKWKDSVNAESWTIQCSQD